MRSISVQALQPSDKCAPTAAAARCRRRSALLLLLPPPLLLLGGRDGVWEGEAQQ